MIDDPINVADFERLCADSLDAGPLAYYSGGACDERTLADNVAAFARYKLMPRVLVDVSNVDTATSVAGTAVSMPILVAPVALQRMAHPDGEPGMARAAADADTVMCLSTIATATPAEVAEAAPDAPRWFQVYSFKDREITRHLVDQALETGYKALVLTVDAPRAGRRERDFREHFTIPEGIDMPAVTAATGRTAGITVQEVFGLVDDSLTWSGVEHIAKHSPVPVLVKGVHAPADARLAVEHGAAGVIVSNHGGRQLDNVPSAIDLLEPVVQEVGGETEVLVDGGIRRGTDVAVALALGARAVLVGRPALWGLAVGGEAGARRVLQILRDELELALALLGAPTPDAVTREHLA